MHEAALFGPEGEAVDTTLYGVGAEHEDEVAAADGDRQGGRGLDEGDNFGTVLIELGKRVDKGRCLWKIVEAACDGLHVVVRVLLHNLHSLNQSQAEGEKD